MSNQLELVAEERTVSGKHVSRLRKQGIVPANVYGLNQPSTSLQVTDLVLQRLLSHGGRSVILSLKVGSQPAVQAMIKHVQHDPVSGKATHVDFYRVSATEKLKTQIQLHFINEAGPASLGDVVVLRPLNEVLVECLPVDLPPSIQVDLSRLTELGAVLRVGDLPVDPGVTILTDHNEMVAAVHQQARAEKADEAEGEAEAATSAPGTPAT